MTTEKEAIKLLIEHGEKMRNCQKNYFKNRSKITLIDSKNAEREFDNLIFNVKQLFLK